MSAQPSTGDRLRVVVCGAGFGGLEVTTRLAESVGSQVDVTLIDKNDAFVFGFSKLDVMFGREMAEAVRHPYADIEKPGVRFVQASIEEIDPEAKSVVTDAGTFVGDVLVVALGADLHPEATPGLIEAGYEFYTNRGAFELRDVLAGFGGGSVVIAVTSTPFKCPPAPSETALLMHDYLLSRGLRDRSEITLVMPLPVPIPPSPDASAAVLAAFAERGITWRGQSLVRELDAGRKVATMANGDELAFDLFLGVPHHRAPEVVVRAGMTVDGWIPVDPRTLETRFPGVFAAGDVTSVGTPKAGVFAEGQAAVIADRIVEMVNQREGGPEYDGRGICYLEFGNDTVARVAVTFVPGQAPSGTFDDPTAANAEEKKAFGSSRVSRWFDRSS